MLVTMWRRGNLHALLVGMHINTAVMENVMEIPHKTKNIYHRTCLSHFWKYMQRKFSQHMKKMPVLSYLLQPYSQWQKYGIKHIWLAGKRKSSIYTQCSITQPQKRVKVWPCKICMKLGIILWPEVTQIDKCNMFSLTCESLYMCAGTLFFDTQVFTNVMFTELYTSCNITLSSFYNLSWIICYVMLIYTSCSQNNVCAYRCSIYEANMTECQKWLHMCSHWTFLYTFLYLEYF